MEVDSCAAVTHNSPSPLSSFTETNLLTSYRGLFVCSSYMKECLIQLCDASLACFFGSAPSARKKKKNPIPTYLLYTEVYRGTTDSQSVGVVSVQLNAYIGIHHKD